MKTRNIIVMVFMLISTMTFSQSAGRQRKADKATREWRYEIECAGIGKDGTYLIKVWSYSKNPKVATTQAKKNAIHGVIFKGFSGGGQGCTSQRPLAPSPSIEEEKADLSKQNYASYEDYPGAYFIEEKKADYSKKDYESYE